MTSIVVTISEGLGRRPATALPVAAETRFSVVSLDLQIPPAYQGPSE